MTYAAASAAISCVGREPLKRKGQSHDWPSRFSLNTEPFLQLA
jgi:hypothetical protein